jgi:phosphomannomutase
MIDKSIFRAYDIRGNASKNLNKEVAYNIGYYFAKLNIQQLNNRIVVGYDGRLSSPELYEALTSGLLFAGAEVSSIGLVATPILYFADQKLYPAGSIMITGSHNPKEDNGFKMIAAGKSFFGPDIQKLYNEIITDPKKYKKKPEDKKIYSVNVKPFYADRVLKDLNFNPEIRVVWDPGNGAACSILKDIIEKLPNENFIINNEVDGNFPNHHPDPTIPENLEQLIDEVKARDADIGIAFDGDADRIGVVTRSGKIVYGDQLLCVYAEELLRRKAGSIIIADVKASKTMFDYVNSIGGKALMWKTGHSLIKEKMKETGAEIAGEMSGHIFFKDGYLGFDDGIYSALRLLHVLNISDKTIDEIVENLPEAYNTPEIRLDVDDNKKFEIVEKLKEKLDKESADYSAVDGIRADVKNGWWLVRASNTQAALIVRCEAESEEALKNIIKDLNSHIAEFGLKVKA